MKGLQYIGKQLLRMVLLLFVVCILTFGLVSKSPIDPVRANVGQAALASMSQEQKEKLKSYWGLETPVVDRYLNWAKGILRGDLGISLSYRQPVVTVIGVKLANSILLLSTAWLLSGVVGVALGIVAGANKNTRLDRGIHSFGVVMASIPGFWLALLLLMVFGVYLKIFPIGLSVPIGLQKEQVTFLDRLYHSILPALTLSITGLPHIILHSREKVIQVMESEYVLFARGRGESLWNIIKNHGLRNMLLPALTLQFASISEIIGGSVLIEQVFSYPGLGQAAVDAGIKSDVPLLLGITLLTTFLVFMGNFIANALYPLVDTRMKQGRKR